MTIFAFFLFFFIGMRLIVSLVNFITCNFLPPAKPSASLNNISVLIPARNEEANISRLLGDIIRFKNQPLEVLVYDDASIDKTAEIVSGFAQKTKGITLIRGTVLPSGWLGKNHACYQLAKNAKGEYLLFLDADVKIGDNLFKRAFHYAEKKNLDLLSIFPQQILGSLGEKLTVPLMNWILLSLLPLPLIRLSKNPAFSAANGQFMLFRADVYHKLQPHEQHRAQQVEDITICQFYKKLGLTTATLLGDSDMQCRMYRGLLDAINGFSKNVFHFFGNSIMVTIAFGLLTTLAPIFLWWHVGVSLALLYLAAVVLIRIFVSLASKQNVVRNVLLILPQHFIFLIIILTAIKNHHTKELLWKGRNILQP